MWALSLLLATVVTATDLISCSAQAAKAHPCAVPHPGGLMVFRQRFEPDVGGDQGSWGIDGLQVLESYVTCDLEDGGPVTTNAEPFAPAYDHEHVASFTHRSELFGGEESVLRAEAEWAQSEVGEGVEEVQERTWNTAGRWISTFAPSCSPARREGEEITPSADTTYSLFELVAALTFNDFKPVVTCVNYTLSTILWPLNVGGKFQENNFIPSSKFSLQSTCPPEGIIYPPSITLPPMTTSYTWDPLTRPTPRPITLSYDESKVYTPGLELNPKRLRAFKDYEEERLEEKESKVIRQYPRDEL
ncbi:hypothetical protein TREMEDRAFT_68158 [Tremella mesenterica DSM 1558]|uniref:uncharacterized protein n=1 Tax=Tremella mesenterica (strain ATCC 24925 / CBS 8224 / DSM 1558 / NBRC 9311 / NRRL Y-6157 / RJB 2259-6 / UBC 559-6) TaxID=578456 RepID=UPI0003F49A69|nr:uncharacterized protein TREMEDRAFT_68158 [Tremella mesenterica DSM 1558]EIW70657.1 hypothetical protein TREMEDRAFT_68158 [Tremella mesenterica DSM 1558]